MEANGKIDRSTGRRKVLFCHDDGMVKKLVDHIGNIKKYDYFSMKKGEIPYTYMIRKFAYPKKGKEGRPYHDPDSIILAVMEQELARFMQENLWQDMVDARKIRTGKIPMPKNMTVNLNAALELYDANTFFTKVRGKMEKDIDRKLSKWVAMRRKEVKKVEKEFAAKGLPVKGYEDETTFTDKKGKKRKVKVFISPWSESFNRKHPKEMDDVFSTLNDAQRELADEEMKHYMAIIRNIRHMWI